MRSNMTGVGYYNTEPRNFNRSFGRTIPKPSQQPPRHSSPQPPRRGGDLFTEAGRLAVEYLVSRGMLSSNILSGKDQNGTLQDKDSSRRSSLDEDPRSNSGERRQLGHSRSYSFDLTRENDKEGPLIEEGLSLRAMEVDSNASKKNTSYLTKDDGHSEEREEFQGTKIGVDNHEKEKDNIVNCLNIKQGEDRSGDIYSKSDLSLVNDEENLSAEGQGQDSLDTKNFNFISEKIPSSKSLGFSIDEQKSMETLSFMGKKIFNEENPSELPEIGMLCTSVGNDRGQKRSIEEDKSMEGAKKAKQQWLSVAQSEDYSRLSDLSDKPEKSGVNIFNVSQSDINQSKKQIMSNSFKICDLNLMESSDMHDNHEVPLLYPTVSGPNRDFPVDIDLSMKNNITNEHNASGSVRKDIEIIDLESASLEGSEGLKSSNTSMKNTDGGITTMESVSNQQNSTENPDGQDGYGFMISELLNNEVQNCSSVQPDMNSLHNDMGLNNAEGMFSEDDPIYMSLGEIPLTGLLREWEQPTQERNPFEL